MDLALAEAKKRKQNLGLFYGNYALVVGRSGPETACLRQVKQNAISVSGMPDRIWRFVAGIGVYELLDAAAEEAAAELAIMQYRSISMRMVVSMEALIMAVTPTPERASMEKSCRA